jgi:hypothetical protein
LPSSKFRFGGPIITQSSSGIQVTNNNDLTNNTEFGNVLAEGIEVGFCIQITIFMEEIGGILRGDVGAAEVERSPMKINFNPCHTKLR